jgi:glycosyltransferase involved in cell wall biosynthesis
MKKLAIVSSHPIQYNDPLFRLLTRRGKVMIKVFYTWSQSEKGKLFDPGFNKEIEWDIPLLEGYSYEFVHNTAKVPGSHHFRGIINPDLQQCIRNWKADAVLVYGWSFQSHLKCLLYFHHKIPVFFRGDSTLLDVSQSASLKKWVKYIFLKWVYQHVDVALYVGSANKAYFKQYGIREAQLIRAPHAIDNQRFSNPHAEYETAAANWKKALGIEESDTVFLFAGKLEKKKNVALLLDAFLQASHPTQWLIIVGNGVLEQELKQRAHNNKRVIFMEFQNQLLMPVVYRLGNVVVLPSAGPGETWGLALNEAMACARPIIASTRCGACLDLVTPETGWSFNPFNQTELEKIIQTCHLEKNSLPQKGLASQVFIQNFSLTNIAMAIEGLL